MAETLAEHAEYFSSSGMLHFPTEKAMYSLTHFWRLITMIHYDLTLYHNIELQKKDFLNSPLLVD